MHNNPATEPEPREAWEFVALLLIIFRRSNSWDAVSSREIEGYIQSQRELISPRLRVENRNDALFEAHARSTSVWAFINAWTWGMWGMLIKAPVLRQLPLPFTPKVTPFADEWRNSDGPMRRGIAYLVEQGLLEEVRRTEVSYRPTPKLVDLLQR